MEAEEFDRRPVSGKGGSGRMFQLLIIALLMIGEGVMIFFVTRAVHSGPEFAEAGEAGEGAGPAAPAFGELAEIDLGECRPSNRVTGKLISFQVQVVVLVAPGELERAREIAKAKRERFRDRINFVIRSAEPQHLDEPGLETIRRRLKHEFDRLLDDRKLIKEVLVPVFLQSG